MPNRPLAVAFDVMQTLFSLEPVHPRMQALGLPPESLELWYTRTLRDGVALAAAGGFKPFREVASGELEVMLAERKLTAHTGAIDEVLQGLAELPAEPDVAPAAARLTEAGVHVLALTNGNGETTRRLIWNAGLERHFEHIVSIEDMRRWKPHPEVYHHAAAVARVEPSQLALVASHAWDTHGARRAGLITAWFPRTEPLYHPALDPPDILGDSLLQVCNALLESS
jgi:2-haloacid dehalogenase